MPANSKKRGPLIERFFRFAGKKSYEECWNWRGYVGPGGYGEIQKGPKGGGHLMAHRAAWEIFHGPIPEGLVIDHLCRNRRCVNPVHLRTCTMKENILCGVSLSAVNAKKTHCFNGHSLADAYISILRNGNKVRRCRTCQKITRRRPRSFKFTMAQAVAIRKLWNNGGISKAKLAKMFDTSPMMILAIIRNSVAYLRE